jgi:hypothetical protein
MMRLRDWPPRRIGRLWLAGLAMEALLVAVIAFTGDDPRPMPGPHLGHYDSATADTASGEVVRQSFADAGFTVAREPLASGDTLVRISRDSSFVAARVRGDTIPVVAASPDVEQAIGNITTAFVAAMDGLARILLILAAILLPIPVLLISVTLVWAVQRRRRTLA